MVEMGKTKQFIRNATVVVISKAILLIEFLSRKVIAGNIECQLLIAMVLGIVLCLAD